MKLKDAMEIAKRNAEPAKPTLIIVNEDTFDVFYQTEWDRDAIGPSIYGWKEYATVWADGGVDYHQPHKG